MIRKWSGLHLALVALVAGAGSCGTQEGPGGDAGTDTGLDGIGACTATAEADLSGWWAMRAFVRLEMHEDPAAAIHVCDDPPLAMALVTWVIRLDGTSGTIPATFRICAIQLPQVTASLADCSMDETFVAYLLTSDALDGTLDDVEHETTVTVTDAGGCARLETDGIFVRIGIPSDFDDTAPLPGWDLECAGTTATECVPGYETDVRDTDSDGAPGGTFEIDTDPAGLVDGVAWATLRHTPDPDGIVTGNSLVRGGLAPGLEYDLVGSDAEMSGLPMDTPTVKRNLPDFAAIPEGSTFVMVRVDGAHGSVDLTGGDGVVECSDVLEAAGLFD
jgi:hypothetical protein